MKPIFVITIDRRLSAEQCQKFIQHVREQLKEEYHVIAIGGDEMKFQMFSDKEIEPIEIESLKEMLRIEQ